MSNHTIAMFVNWALNSGSEVNNFLDSIVTNIKPEDRFNNTTIRDQVRSLKAKWTKGSKIERLAVLGWIEDDSVRVFCDLLNQLPQLRKEFKDEINLYGNPKIDDKDLEQYEKEVRKIGRML
jgi:hypothetical protein